MDVCAVSRKGTAVSEWRGQLEKKGRGKCGIRYCQSIRKEEHELFEIAWEDMLHHEEDIVGRETNDLCTCH